MKSCLLYVLFFYFGICIVIYGATDPGNAGSFTPGMQTFSIPATQNTTLSTDIHYPKLSNNEVDPAAGLCPVIIFGHGFSRSKAQYANIGAHLASRGFIVMIPNFSGSDHSKNADDFTPLLNWIIQKNSDPASIFYGHISPSSYGTSGHSAGGMSALVALSRDDRFIASSTMDPVDNNDLGKNAMPLINIPVAITYSEPHSCNDQGSAVTLYNAGNPQKRGIKIVNANHCDPEDPTNLLCTLVCGAQNTTRMYRYRKYMTGWFEYYLHCDGSYEPWVFGSEVQSDINNGYITYNAVLTPPIPSGINATGNDCITISINPPKQCNGISGWRIYRSTTPGSNYIQIAEINDPNITSYTDYNVQPGYTYYYIAKYYFNSLESNISNEVSSTPISPCFNSSPGSVGNNKNHIGIPLTISKINNFTLLLNWGNVCNAIDYAIYRGTIPFVQYNHQPIYCTTSNATSFELTADADSYYFLVVALNDTNEGSLGETSSNQQIPQIEPYYCKPQSIGNCN